MLLKQNGQYVATELIRGLTNISTRQQGCAVTIGNFDGVHIGHKLLIEQLKQEARDLNVPSLLMTFEPQPLEYLFPERPVPRLTRFREKFYQLAQTGIDYVLVVLFNEKFVALSAVQFMEQVLNQTLQAKKIIIGEDFHFGRGRLGNAALLADHSKHYGFSVVKVPSVTVDHERVSSTRVRQALLAADLPAVKNLLGRPYTMMGRVVMGNQLGRVLGFPTANIHLHRRASPVQGIYAVKVYGIADHALPGVANVGHRPTIGGTRTLLEVYLFNFNQDIYGKYVTVEFCKKFRDEQLFANLDLLREQMKIDAQNARDFFIAQGELR